MQWKLLRRILYPLTGALKSATVIDITNVNAIKLISKGYTFRSGCKNFIEEFY